jgi:hydrogenase maturation protease
LTGPDERPWGADRPRPRLLILGIGNILLRDEGLGVHLVRALAEDPGRLPDGTAFLDGGTLGLDLLPEIGEADALLLVDAVRLRDRPGAVRVIHGEEIHATLAGHISPHQIGLADLVAAARLLGCLPERVSLVAMQPADIEVGLELSAPVAAALPLAISIAREESWRLAGDREGSAVAD